MKGDLFKGVMQWEMQPLDKKFGKRSFKLPIYYYDNLSFTAIYTASTAKVKPFLPDDKMHPVEILPGRCLVAFTAFEYRKTDIDPYNEFSIAVIISYGKRQIPGFTVLRQMMTRRYQAYVWHLPVTTEIARHGGIELYGFPKFIGNITMKRSGTSVECMLSEKKTHILTLSGPALKTGRGNLTRYRTYPVRDGVTLCGNVFVRHHEYAESRNTRGVTLSLGSGHDIADELRSIGLSDKAVLFQYSPQNEAILFGPRNLMDD